MSKLKPFKISMPPEDLARFRSAQADAKRLVNRMLSEPCGQVRSAGAAQTRP